MPDSRRGHNHLSVHVFTGYTGTTPVVDPDSALALASVARLSKFYPGGLFGEAELFIPRDVRRALPFDVGQRLVLRNGHAVVWEGVVNDIALAVSAGEQGYRVTGHGYWGDLLGRRGVNKPWCDMRVSDDAWSEQAVLGGGETKDKFDLQRFDNGFRFVPKGVAVANGDYRSVIYTAPTGQTVKRVTFSYELQEGLQNWQLMLWNVTAGSSDNTITASGTGTVDDTLSAPSQSVALLFYSGAAQTPTEDGTYFGQFSDIKVYTETSAINLSEIATDVAGLVSELSTDTSGIGSNTYDLTPFVTNGYEMLASVLARAWGFGDSSQNQWAAYLDEGDASGKPRLVVEQQPALSDFDYQISLDELTTTAGIQIVRSRAELYNWIVTAYRDELNNRDVILTPDDDANLENTLSVATYGERQYVLAHSQASAAAAKNAARRFLAAHKDPVYYVSGPIAVQGYLRDKNGVQVAASEIRPGKRLKLVDFVPDLAGVSGAGLTQRITGVDYSDGDEMARISLGVPDDLSVILAQMAAGVA